MYSRAKSWVKRPNKLNWSLLYQLWTHRKKKIHNAQIILDREGRNELLRAVTLEWKIGFHKLPIQDFAIWNNDQFVALHQFRRKLAIAFINNEFIQKDSNVDVAKRSRKRSQPTEIDQTSCSVPPHAKQYWQKWDLSSKAKYLSAMFL